MLRVDETITFSSQQNIVYLSVVAQALADNMVMILSFFRNVCEDKSLVRVRSLPTAILYRKLSSPRFVLVPRLPFLWWRKPVSDHKRLFVAPALLFARKSIPLCLFWVPKPLNSFRICDRTAWQYRLECFSVVFSLFLVHSSRMPHHGSITCSVEVDLC